MVSITPRERGNCGLWTTGVTQNNGGSGERVGKALALAWLQATVVPWDSCRTQGKRV